MQRLVGSVLNSYMSSFVKNYSSENFQNWELKNLEFKEDVVQDLLNVPPNLNVLQVKCSSLSVSIPWSSLNTKPVIFYLGRIDIVLSEPVELRAVVPKPKEPSKETSRGFASKLIEGVKLEISELHFTIQTLGPKKDIGLGKWSPPALRLDAHGIVIQSTNSTWQVVEDLRETRQINDKAEIILYKVMRLDSVSLSLLQHGAREAIPIIQDTPISSHVKQKKRATTGELLYFQVDLNVDQLLLSLSVEQYQLCRGLLEGVLSCFARQPIASDTTTTPGDKGEAEPDGNGHVGDGSTTLSISMGDSGERGLEVDEEEKSLREYKNDSEGEGGGEDGEAPSIWDRFKSILYRSSGVDETPDDGSGGAVVRESFVFSPPDSSESDDDSDASESEYLSCEDMPPIDGLDAVVANGEGAARGASGADGGDPLNRDVSALWQDLGGSGPQQSQLQPKDASDLNGQAALQRPQPTEEAELLESQVEENKVPDDAAVLFDANMATDDTVSELEEEDLDPFDDEGLQGFGSSEDINKVSYNFLVKRGRIDLQEMVVGSPRGLARIEFEDFRATFIPDSVTKRQQDRKRRKKSRRSRRKGIATANEEQQDEADKELHQTEIQLVLMKFSLHELLPSRLKHNGYTTMLCSSSFAQAIKEGTQVVEREPEPYMKLQYIQYSMPSHVHSSYYSSKEVKIVFNGVQVVFDRDVWKRLHSYFAEAPRSKLLDKAVGETVDAVVESMLYDYIQFRLEAINCAVILPPYAGHSGPEHIASQVLRLHSDRVVFASCDPKTQPPPVFEKGLFNPSVTCPLDEGLAFDPSHIRDFTSTIKQNIDPTLISHKFQMKVNRLWCEMLPHPMATPLNVLDPLDMNVVVFFHEFREFTALKPQLEFYLQLSEISVQINKHQYLYFLTVLDERLAWSRARLVEEGQQHAEKLMEMMIAASMSGVPQMSAELTEIPHTKDDGPPILFMVMLKVDKGGFGCNEGHGRLAQIEFDSMDLVFENHIARNIVKCNMSKFQVLCPQHRGSPFYVLFTPLGRYQSKSETPMKRDDKGKEKEKDPISTPSTKQQPTTDAGAGNVNAKEKEKEKEKEAEPIPDISSSTPDIKRRIEMAAILEHAPNLQVRWEKKSNPADLHEHEALHQEHGEADRATMIAHKKLWVWLFDVQVGLILTTLAKIQLFFSSEEVEYEGQASQNRFNESVKSYISDQIQGFRSDWDLIMENCEALVVENPEAPECIPMEIQKLHFKTRGKPAKMIIDVEGNVSLFSFMYRESDNERKQPEDLAAAVLSVPLPPHPREGDAFFDASDDLPSTEANAVHFVRESLTAPFDIQVSYIRTKLEKGDDAWNNNILVVIDALETTMARSQFIMILNILDNQLTGIDEVSKLIQEDKLRKEEEAEQESGLREARLGPNEKGKEKVTSGYGQQQAGKRAGPSEDQPATAKEYNIPSNRFSIVLKRCRWVLLELQPGTETNIPFAQIDFSRLTYNRESWSHLSNTSMTIHAFQITDLRPSTAHLASLFKTLVRPKRKVSTSSSKNDLATDIFEVDTVDTIELEDEEESPHMFSLAYDRFDPSGVDPAGPEIKIAWRTRWVIDIQHLLIVNVTDILPSFTEFFKLLEAQKNLRRQYQQMQTGLQRFISENVMSQQDMDKSMDSVVLSKKQLKRMQRISEDVRKLHKSEEEGFTGVMFKILLKDSALMMPEQFNEMLTSVLEVGIDTLFISNDNESIYNPFVRRTHCMVSGCRVGLETVDTRSNEVLQTVPIVHPVSVQMIINSKKQGADGSPFTHVNLDVDSIKAIMSITKYQTAANILYTSLLSFFKSDDAPAAGQPAAPSTPRGSDPKNSGDGNNASKALLAPEVAREVKKLRKNARRASKKKKVNRLIEINLKHLDLTIVSDYVEELELFFVYLKNVDAELGLYGDTMVDFSMNMRFEALVNNLTFRTPEPFIQPVQLALALTKSVQTEAEGNKSSSLEIQAIVLDQLRIHVTKELIRHIMEIYELFNASSAQAAKGGSRLEDSREKEKEERETEKDKIVIGRRRRIISSSQEGKGKEKLSGDEDEEDAEMKGKQQKDKDKLDHEKEKNRILSDMHSHFQYILRNKTEARIVYSQAHTSDTKVLNTGKEVSFSFSNPYQPKLLELMLIGWTKTPGFPLDTPGVHVIPIYYTSAAFGSSSSADIFLDDDLSDSELPPEADGSVGTFAEARQGFSTLSGLPHAFRGTIIKMGKRVGEVVTTNPLDILKSHNTNKITRNITVAIKSVGMKRYVDILASHQVYNKTDENLDIQLSGEGFTTTYSCPPGKRTPICYHKEWEMTMRIRPSHEWNWSLPLSLDLKKLGVHKAFIPSTHVFRHRNIYMSSEISSKGVISIIFSPPIIIENLTIYPLEYSFVSLGAGGIITPNSRKSFYFDDQEYPEVEFRMLEYTTWSKSIKISKSKHRIIELKKEEGHENEGGTLPSIQLNVFVRPRLNKLARTLYVNTQFVFTNATNFVLMVRQRGQTSYLTLNPKDRKPFSWHRVGAKQVEIRVANGGWSRGMPIYLKAVTRLRMAIPELDLNYELLMDVKLLDEFSRVVTFTTRLHFVNQTGRALSVSAGPYSSLTSVVEAHSTLDSAVSADNMALSVAPALTAGADEEEGLAAASAEVWSLEPFSVAEEGTFTLRLRNMTKREGEISVVSALESAVDAAGGSLGGEGASGVDEDALLRTLHRNVEYLAVDVTVKIEETGIFVYFSENIHPPYILQNASPYWLKVTQAYHDDNAGDGDKRKRNGAPGRNGAATTGNSNRKTSGATAGKDASDRLHQTVVDIPYTDEPQPRQRWKGRRDTKNAYAQASPIAHPRQHTTASKSPAAKPAKDPKTHKRAGEGGGGRRKRDELDEAREAEMGLIVILPPYSSLPYHWQRPNESKPRLTVRIICDQRKEELLELQQEVRERAGQRASDGGAAGAPEVPRLLLDLGGADHADTSSARAGSGGRGEDSRRPLARTDVGLRFHGNSHDGEDRGTAASDAGHTAGGGGLLSFLSPSRRVARKQRETNVDDADESTSASDDESSDTELLSTNGAVNADPLYEVNSGDRRKSKRKGKRKQRKRKKSLPFPGIPLHVKREKGEGGMVITGDGGQAVEDQGDLLRSLSLSTRATKRRARVGSQSSPIKKSGWALPFPIDIIGDDFELKFADEDIDLDNYTLCMDVSVRGRGATRMVTFMRSTDDHSATAKLATTPRDAPLSPRRSTAAPNTRHSGEHNATPVSSSGGGAGGGVQQRVRVKFRIPLVDIKFTSELNENDEILRTTITEINADMFMGPTKEYFYFFVQNLQMDNMYANAEYPVLLAMDRRKLYGYDANLVELLVETSVREGFKSIDYLGLRVLPLVCKLDGELMKTAMDLQAYFNFFASKKGAEDEDEEDEEEDDKVRKKTFALYSNIKTEAEIPTLNITEEVLKKVYVEKLQIFPLEFTFCVGDNELSWPVIQDETPVELVPLEKGEMYETTEELARVVTKYYSHLAKDEVYRIILSLDAIGGPRSVFSKITKGCKDAVILPWSSLVLDDTPGAFFVGLASGTWSLFFNVSDASLTLLLRLIGWASWISLSLTFDPEYKLVKRKVRRNHPPNVWNGLAQGSRELGRGIWSGISGLITEGYKGAKNEGCVGLIKGLWRGVVGLPVKPIGGFFDLLGKTLEGLLHSMGTGYTTQNRIHDPMERIRQLSFNQETGIQYWLERINERYGGHCYVKIRTRRGRLRDRLLVLTSASFHIINIEGLTEEEDYQPKTVPLAIITEILVPLFPETSFTVCASKVLHGRDKFHFVVPDRDSIIGLLKQLISEHQGKRIKVRGVCDDRTQTL